jgi:hypothetical protein
MSDNQSFTTYAELTTKKRKKKRASFKPDRSEINRQVKEYLSRGGKIKIVVLEPDEPVEYPRRCVSDRESF